MALDKVTVGVLADEAVTSAKLDTNLQVDGTLGVTGNTTASGNLTVTGDIVPTTPLSNRNMIINGAMQISQRCTTTAPTPKGANDAGYFITDRWRLNCAGTTPSRFNLIQESITDLAGFHKALKIDCTTASASPGADDEVRISQRLEGQNVQQIGKGITGANAVTISFYVKGTASRTYMVELADHTNTQICQQQFTATTSWVRHTFVCPAYTAGNSLANTTANIMELSFFLHAGTNFTSGAYNANTWKSTVTADRAVGMSGSGAGVMATTSDELYITGVQMELGSNATPFENRFYSDELLRCQRYYQNSYRQNQEVIGGGSANYPSSQPASDDGMYNTSWSDGNISGPTFPVAMRTQPTITLKSFASNTAGKCTVSGTEQSCTATTYNHQWVSHLVVGGSHANGAFVHYAYEASAEL